MSTTNSFGLLGDDDCDDPTQLLAAVAEQKKLLSAAADSKKSAAAAAETRGGNAKFPSKPLPPAQAVKEEARTEGSRGGGRSAGRGDGRGRGSDRYPANGRPFNRDSAGSRGYNRDSADSRGVNSDSADYKNSYGGNDEFSRVNRSFEDGNQDRTGRRDGYGGPRGGYRGGRQGGYTSGDATEGNQEKTERNAGYGGPRGGYRGDRQTDYSNGDAADWERPQRTFERRSGTGRGNEFKRDGAGRGNWGTPIDAAAVAQQTEDSIEESEKAVDAEKPAAEDNVGDAIVEKAANEPEEKEPEKEEMTLEEYEKVLEEKRKALLALKTEERKVGLDKELESMQLLSNKKGDGEIFVKLGNDKDKRKEVADREEKKKSVSINEFLKPAEGERFYNPGGRGRGRGRGSRGGYTGPDRRMNAAVEIPINDAGQFPLLGVK